MSTTRDPAAFLASLTKDHSRVDPRDSRDRRDRHRSRSPRQRDSRDRRDRRSRSRDRTHRRDDRRDERRDDRRDYGRREVRRSRSPRPVNTFRAQPSYDRPPPRQFERRRSPPRDRDRGRRSGPNTIPEYSPPPPNIVPLHLRPRKLHQWDVRPKGYETITSEQAKSTGAFLLPSHLLRGTGNFSNAPPEAPFAFGATQLMIESVMAANLNPRQQKRLYVGGLPAGVTEAEIVDFICESYDKLGANKEAGRVCISANINEEKHYCFVEFRNPEETTEGMALDRSVFKGQELQVRRPKDFNTPGGGQLMKAGDFSSPNKIYVGGIPSHLNDEQIKDLLQAFGDLRSFKLLKDQITGESKGQALCEYANPDLTDIACEGLHGLELGEGRLIMQRASVAMPALMGGALPAATPILPIEIIGQAALKNYKATSILLLLNTVAPDTLEDDDQYQDIVQDIQDECERFGKVTEVIIPRPLEGAEIPGLGKVFIKYESAKDAAEAHRSLAGRKYEDRVVLTTFFDEIKYGKRKFE